MKSSSYIEIDSLKYRNNLDFIHKTVAKNSELCLVVKGNAYGHGSREILKLARNYGVKTFAVFDSLEAYQIIDLIGDDCRLIVMGGVDQSIAWLMEKGLEFHVHDKSNLEDAIKLKERGLGPAKIHLELETGMNRFGIDRSQFHDTIKLLQDHADLFEIKGICTHLAGAESINNFVRVKKQIRRFEGDIKLFNERGIPTAGTRHVACSAAAVRFKKTRLDMVRIGILQYGFWPSQETFIDYSMSRQRKDNPLQRIISWKSRVVTIKDVPIGDYVGYGTSFLAEANKKIAIVPIGYASGFSRNLSNRGRVLIRGRIAPVAGIVNMNAISVDITDIPSVDIGDEVVLIGNQGDQSISVSSFSDYSDQLNYELLTRLPVNIPRFVV